MNSSYYEVVCVSTNIDNIGYKRFIDTCYKHNINVKTLGVCNKWEGGDMEAGKGGGQKVNLLKEYLDTHEHLMRTPSLKPIRLLEDGFNGSL